jgi:hypothetical protein
VLEGRMVQSFGQVTPMGIVFTRPALLFLFDKRYLLQLLCSIPLLFEFKHGIFPLSTKKLRNFRDFPQISPKLS